MLFLKIIDKLFLKIIEIQFKKKNEDNKLKEISY